MDRLARYLWVFPSTTYNSLRHKAKEVPFLVVLLLSFWSYAQKSIFNTAQEKKKILELHHLERVYHFNKDSVGFVGLFSDNFISVNKGQITTPSHEESMAKYATYFSLVEFVKWDDVAQPIIRFSEDGTMAYKIVDKIVEIKYKNEKGEEQRNKSHFAWTTIYKKYGGNWKIECVTSTKK